MPSLTRQRLQCFYCGKKSLQRYEYRLSKWRCEHCLADNYLDADGEITEPPSTVAPTPTRATRFAQVLPQSSQPASSGHDQSPFCQTCLNNQYLITQNLANYLPETTDPRYAEFENNLPKYKQELEERYPPVCVNCEIVVSKRIRDAGAFAKADYLRRMMQKTRTVGLTRSTWTSASIFRLIGGLLWFYAAGILIIWNGFGALSDYQVEQTDPISDQSQLNLFRCMGEAVAFGRVHMACATHIYYLAGWGVVANLASSWWNPIMHRRNIDRTTGLMEFYKLQTMLLVARCGTWYLLGNDSQYNFDSAMVRTIHATMLAMNACISLLAYFTPRIAKTPHISFHDDHEPLVNGKEGQSGHTSNPSPLSINTQAVTISTSTSFPFNKIATTPNKERTYQQKLTIDEDIDKFDAMDIDSPQPKHNLRPTSSRAPKVLSQEPSPFYGKIPPAPVSQEHRLRNPPNKPSFQKTSSERQEKFFQSMVQPRPSTSEGKLDSSIEFHMQEPKLVIKQDNQETGLEKWFSSNVFSLGESKTTSSQNQTINQEKDLEEPELARSLLNLIPIMLLLGAVTIWLVAPKLGPQSLYLYQCAILMGAIVAANRLTDVVSRPAVNSSDVLLCIAELLGAAMLAYQTHQAKLLQLDIDVALGSLPTVYFAFMLMQECIIIITAYRRGGRSVALCDNIDKDQASLSSNKSSQTRKKKPLPFDEGTALFQSQPKEPVDQKIGSKHDDMKSRETATVEHLSKSATLGGLKLNSRQGLSSNSMPIPSTKHNTRTTRARTPNPWEVGGI